MKWLIIIGTRFAQFFINPLMSADGTLRELKAVDSGNVVLPDCIFFSVLSI